MQTIVVFLSLAAAVAYALWRIRQLWIRRTDPCYGCDGCSLKKQVCDKKTSKKFG